MPFRCTFAFKEKRPHCGRLWLGGGRSGHLPLTCTQIERQISPVSIQFSASRFSFISFITTCPNRPNEPNYSCDPVHLRPRSYKGTQRQRIRHTAQLLCCLSPYHFKNSAKKCNCSSNINCLNQLHSIVSSCTRHQPFIIKQKLCVSPLSYSFNICLQWSLNG